MTFRVVIQPSGHEFEIEPEESILDAALRNGFAFSYGCRAGSCGSCKGKVISGDYCYEDDEKPIALSEHDEKTGMCIFCQAMPLSDMELEVREISAAKDIVTKVLPTRVTKMEKLAPDVMRIYLKLPMIERLQFLAGQYLDILLQDGRRRSFSIANSPHDDELLELHIRHVVDGEYTTYVFEKMKEKELLRIEGPLGSFFLREDSDRPIIFIAGGTGFAPIKGIIEHAIAEGSKRPIHLYWGARNKTSLYLYELAANWKNDLVDYQFTPVLSDAADGDQWSGKTGMVHEVVLSDFDDFSKFDIYASGPPAMIDAIADTFREKGMSTDHFYYDAFTFANDRD